MQKKVACDIEAAALASMVLPVPGGPQRIKPKSNKTKKTDQGKETSH